jgi:RimJ/RimL family protein N-acetyltransferase
MRHVEPPVVLADGQVTIRPYRAGDVDRHYDAVCASVENVARWLDWCHAGYSRAESHTWIASRPDAWAQQKAYSFAVVDAAHDDHLLGACGLNQINPAHGVASMGYWVRSDRSGEGIATRAARLIARFGFETLGLHRIEIMMQPENRGSQRVAEKLGAVHEGECRHRVVVHGAPRNVLLYGLLPSD